MELYPPFLRGLIPTLQCIPSVCGPAFAHGEAKLEDQTKKLQKDMKKSTDADLAMSKSAVKISSDLLANPLCEQEPSFLEMVTAFDTAMKRMDSFNQEKAREELRPVKEDFEAKNKQLLEEMPKFYSSRIDYFKPSFESLVRAQVRHCPWYLAPSSSPAWALSTGIPRLCPPGNAISVNLES
ncbi:hypothetical protein TURU_037180 [Turdus rufiventris]|nr:hypothetical protein TURU_037180 [Turdus rufiventris]